MLTMTRATLGLALMAAASSVAGAQTVRIAVSPTSKLWFEGTSNVHDWKCDAKALDAVIEIDATAPALGTASPTLLRKVSVRIPVKQMKCGHDKMDDNMYKALKADANDEISYVMATFAPVVGEKQDEFGIKTEAKLRVAGVEKPVVVEVAATRLADGTIKAVGTVPMKMTNFGVKPPTAMFGAIRAGDEVKVKFEMTVGPKVVAAALSAAGGR